MKLYFIKHIVTLSFPSCSTFDQWKNTWWCFACVYCCEWDCWRRGRRKYADHHDHTGRTTGRISDRWCFLCTDYSQWSRLKQSKSAVETVSAQRLEFDHYFIYRFYWNYYWLKKDLTCSILVCWTQRWLWNFLLALVLNIFDIVHFLFHCVHLSSRTVTTHKPRMM